MKIVESLRISWRAITGHKLRSSLTTLGVIIGVGSVIVFMVLGGAFEANIVDDIEEDNEEPGMWVNTQVPTNGGVMFSDAAIYTETDLEQLRSIDGVKYVSPEAELGAAQLIHEDQRQAAGFSIQATNQALVNDSEYVAGEPFDGGNETVLTKAMANMTDERIEVGEQIEVVGQSGSSQTYTVTGIINETSGGGATSSLTAYVPVESNYDTVIETPDETRERAYSSLIIVTEGPEVVDSVKQEAVDYFDSEEAHAPQLKQDNQEIKVQTVDDAIDQISSVIDQLTIFIGGIAGISLIVGSIGIANIMIVSVTERTREIGIMKAVGGRRRDIVQLFLVESIILGIFGAILGVAVGLGFGYLGVSLIGWPMAYPLDWIAIAVAVGVGVGVLSGLYPAYSAARVDPIEALRHE